MAALFSAERRQESHVWRIVCRPHAALWSISGSACNASFVLPAEAVGLEGSALPGPIAVQSLLVDIQTYPWQIGKDDLAVVESEELAPL
jgi:hypothetical protein